MKKYLVRSVRVRMTCLSSVYPPQCLAHSKCSIKWASPLSLHHWRYPHLNPLSSDTTCIALLNCGIGFSEVAACWLELCVSFPFLHMIRRLSWLPGKMSSHFDTLWVQFPSRDSLQVLNSLSQDPRDPWGLLQTEKPSSLQSHFKAVLLVKVPNVKWETT